METSHGESTSTLPAEILSWIESSTTSSVTRTQRVPGGSTREAWFVDVGKGEQHHELFLRFDRRSADHASIFWSLQIEAKIFQALYGSGVAVPAIHASHPTLQAILAERVDGDTWFYRIADPDEQVATAQDFIRNLAALHRLDARELDVPELGAVRAPAEHARSAIAAIRRLITGVANATVSTGTLQTQEQSADPFLEVCLDWLEANIPDYEGPTVLVQGDTGPGNFMYRDGKVTAVVDWELAHFGDPMDDIAWLSLRAVQDTFTYFPDRLAEYEKLTGFAIDESRVWFYRLLGEVQLAAVGLGKRSLAAVAAAGDDPGNALIYGLLHRRLLIEAFASAAGVALTPRVDHGVSDEPAINTPNSASDVHEALLLTLKSVSEHGGSALAVARTKAAARLVRYLKDLSADGPRIAQEEWDDVARILAETANDTVAQSFEDAERKVYAALRDGHLSTEQFLAWRWRSIGRQSFLARHALGALNTRTWPPLR